LVLAFLFAVPSLPQEKKPQAPVTLRATAEIVLVDVVVKDKDGNFIKNLKASDFQVFEDNKSQQLLSCDFQNPDEAVLKAENAPPSPPTPADMHAPAPPPPSPETPAALQQFNDRRLLILFFDFSGMQPDEIERSVAAGEKFVDRQIAPADLVALASFSSSL